MKEKRNVLSEKERNNGNDNLFHKLSTQIEYQNCKKLFTYVSFGSEIDTIAMINLALNENKKVYIPRVEGKEMQFYSIGSMDDLIRSKYGILEPEMKEENRYITEYICDNIASICRSEDEVVQPNLMLLPGLAFDYQGNRVGYGAGYYDKYLDSFSKKHFHKIGLAYEFQIMEQIDTFEFDKKVDMIMTSQRIIYCK